MSGFIGRVIQWLAQDILVKGLANNRRFQGLVLKIDGFVNGAHKTIVTQGEQAVKYGTKVIKEGKEQMLKDPEIKKLLDELAKTASSSSSSSSSSVAKK